MVAYLDDILIFSPDWESHVGHLRTVLFRLQDHQLYAKLEKCLLGVQKIAFLRYVISPSAIRMDSDKVKAITDWVQPTNLTALECFLGFANFYRNFIRNFSVVAKPLTDLTKKRARVDSWSREAVEAFVLLQRAFSTAPVLAQPELDRPFIIKVDASEHGVGAVLSEESPG
ncbi:uncharacterized protein [Eleutherodactylus coqui]|uniref:uncharacterized protein n=1 Tax=Eleutherodactylus coqui TaxID=57060 RepID=UPI0034617FBA